MKKFNVKKWIAGLLRSALILLERKEMSQQINTLCEKRKREVVPGQIGLSRLAEKYGSSTAELSSIAEVLGIPLYERKRHWYVAREDAKAIGEYLEGKRKEENESTIEV